MPQDHEMNVKEFFKVVNLESRNTKFLIVYRSIFHIVPPKGVQIMARLSAENSVPITQEGCAHYVEIIFDLDISIITHIEHTCCDLHGLQAVKDFSEDLEFLESIYDQYNSRLMSQLFNEN